MGEELAYRDLLFTAAGEIGYPRAYGRIEFKPAFIDQPHARQGSRCYFRYGG
jgi:hypothetical protein